MRSTLASVSTLRLDSNSNLDLDDETKFLRTAKNRKLEACATQNNETISAKNPDVLINLFKDQPETKHVAHSTHNNTKSETDTFKVSPDRLI